MRVILLGRKPVTCDALRYMKSRSVDVAAVVAPGRSEPDFYSERLVDVAEAFGIPVVQDQLLYDSLEGKSITPVLDLRDIDLVISVLHQKRIRRSLIELGRIGCINFHPAPLPEYRGWGTYNLAILENVKYWGVSAHFVDDTFDTGPIIRTCYFDVDTSKETTLSLEQRTRPVLFTLFKKVLEMALERGALPCVPQGAGRYISKKEVMERRYITPHDSAEMVERKIRAFWYPPHPGAQVQVAGRYYTIVSQELLDQVGSLIFSQTRD